MSKDIKINLEIGHDLKEVIIALIESVDNENNRLSDDRACLSPGEEVQKAFGIDITDIIKNTVIVKVN